MTLLEFLQYILAAIALIGLFGLVAYGLTRWVIYIIVWQPWVKVEAVTSGSRSAMIWCEKDACECYIPECAEHGCMDHTGSCDYCSDGKRTGLHGNACENCMNSGLRYPEKEYPKATPTFPRPVRATTENIGGKK